jgi:kynurenine formamidase
MFIDLTVQITPELIASARENEQKAREGHLGTHFDVMNKEFPLAYVERKAVVFDVSAVRERDIFATDINLALVEADMFVAFYSGFIEEHPYGSRTYFFDHPQLADELIDQLLERQVSIIGIDFAGVRRGAEHTPKDQYCADRGVFIVENLCNLQSVLGGKRAAEFTANTYPVKQTGITGLPCRVVAKV